ncbi:MAG: MBL fold metallo-hydrolase [Candidatus Saccharibacteria bacterium]
MRIVRLLAVVLVVLLLLAGCSDASRYSDSINSGGGKKPAHVLAELLKIHFIDVGQGDCVLVQMPGSRTMMVDAGESDHAGSVIRYMNELGVRRIDYLIATHPHSDHIGALPRIIKSFNIGAVFMPKVVSSTPAYERLLLAIRDKNLKAAALRKGTFILNEPELKIECMSPASADYQELNDWSAVLRIEYGSKGFLLTGDAGRTAEHEMIKTGESLRADVIKISHHGSSDASSYAFLQRVRPEYAVIAVGKDNDYGHPHQQTLDSLESIGTRIYRTDRDGTVVISCDGQKISFVSQQAGSLPRAPSVKSSQNVNQKNGGPFIGNRRSHKFHLIQCDNLPGEQNRVYFDDREEAVAAGYSPCGSCRP